MQKKIIALAIAAAFSAPAFADTTVYGVVDAAVISVTSSGHKGEILAFSSGLAGSRLGVKSVQDAGDMKVVAVAEYALDTQTSGGIGAARQEMLALAGGFGTFATGYLQTTGYDWAVKFDPTAGSAVSPLTSLTGGSFLVGVSGAANRAPRALAYISPDLGGVTVAVNYTTELLGGVGNAATLSSADSVKATAYLLSATYTGGPLAVGGVYAKTSLPGGYGQKTDLALGASFDFGAAKVFATYQNDKTTGTPTPAVAAVAAHFTPGVFDPVTGLTGAAVAHAATPAVAAVANPDVTNKAMSIGVVAPVGPGAIAASYAKNTITGNNLNGSGLTVAYLQGLSKTSTVYVALEKVNNGSAQTAYGVGNNTVTPATAGGSSTLIAVGLNNKF